MENLLDYETMKENHKQKVGEIVQRYQHKSLNR